ncbi:unnamed protein product [Closterium sp. Yama58-4]|nr:unnamed protein product [Closterium sp. Yama58-4]
MPAARSGAADPAGADDRGPARGGSAALDGHGECSHYESAGALTSVALSLPSRSHFRRSLTPIALSLLSLSHSRRSLTPVALSIPSRTSLPSLSHSRRTLTSVALPLPSRSHSLHPRTTHTTCSHMFPSLS